MGIQPDQFWDMSLKEFIFALDGFMEFNSPVKNNPLTRAELNELMELYPD